jgi:hypothetical protein
MLTMRIGRRYKRDADGTLRCANLNCRVPLEPPIFVNEFYIGTMDRKLYRRPFCVKCEQRLKRAADNVIVELF